MTACVRVVDACRHHQHGRWQARIGRVSGNKDLYLGTFSMSSFFHLLITLPSRCYQCWLIHPSREACNGISTSVYYHAS